MTKKRIFHISAHASLRYESLPVPKNVYLYNASKCFHTLSVGIMNIDFLTSSQQKIIQTLESGSLPEQYEPTKSSPISTILKQHEQYLDMEFTFEPYFIELNDAFFKVGLYELPLNILKNENDIQKRALRNYFPIDEKGRFNLEGSISQMPSGISKKVLVEGLIKYREKKMDSKEYKEAVEFAQTFSIKLPSLKIGKSVKLSEIIKLLVEKYPGDKIYLFLASCATVYSPNEDIYKKKQVMSFFQSYPISTYMGCGKRKRNINFKKYIIGFKIIYEMLVQIRFKTENIVRMKKTEKRKWYHFLFFSMTDFIFPYQYQEEQEQQQAIQLTEKQKKKALELEDAMLVIYHFLDLNDCQMDFKIYNYICDMVIEMKSFFTEIDQKYPPMMDDFIQDFCVKKRRLKQIYQDKTPYIVPDDPKISSIPQKRIFKGIIRHTIQ